jgi:2-iminobutanoate/2-iminopropanoate deaminase
MQFIDSNTDFPISSAVVHSGRVFEAVVTGIPDGQRTPVAGGAAAEMREAFRQLDVLLALAGVDKSAVCTARLYLNDVLTDVAEVNVVWKEYFGNHPVVRRCYGVVLQAGMRVEAAFTAEVVRTT